MSVDLNRGNDGAVPHAANINKFSSQFYEACLSQSELPDVSGVSKRTVDALVVRILVTGYPCLVIGSVAHELRMSKRTFQRYLKKEGTSFSELRDRVRYHYAVEFLIEKDRSIAEVYRLLDFSDRTSLTNAFQRWAGISPSGFKKLHALMQDKRSVQ